MMPIGDEAWRNGSLLCDKWLRFKKCTRTECKWEHRTPNPGEIRPLCHEYFNNKDGCTQSGFCRLSHEASSRSTISGTTSVGTPGDTSPDAGVRLNANSYCCQREIPSPTIARETGSGGTNRQADSPMASNGIKNRDMTNHNKPSIALPTDDHELIFAPPTGPRVQYNVPKAADIAPKVDHPGNGYGPRSASDWNRYQPRPKLTVDFPTADDTVSKETWTDDDDNSAGGAQLYSPASSRNGQTPSKQELDSPKPSDGHVVNGCKTNGNMQPKLGGELGSSLSPSPPRNGPVTVSVSGGVASYMNGIHTEPRQWAKPHHTNGYPGPGNQFNHFRSDSSKESFLRNETRVEVEDSRNEPGRAADWGFFVDTNGPTAVYKITRKDEVGGHTDSPVAFVERPGGGGVPRSTADRHGDGGARQPVYNNRQHNSRPNLQGSSNNFGGNSGAGNGFNKYLGTDKTTETTSIPKGPRNFGPARKPETNGALLYHESVAHKQGLNGLAVNQRSLPNGNKPPVMVDKGTQSLESQAHVAPRSADYPARNQWIDDGLKAGREGNTIGFSPSGSRTFPSNNFVPPAQRQGAARSAGSYGTPPEPPKGPRLAVGNISRRYGQDTIMPKFDVPKTNPKISAGVSQVSDAFAGRGGTSQGIPDISGNLSKCNVGGPNPRHTNHRESTDLIVLEDADAKKRGFEDRGVKAKTVYGAGHLGWDSSNLEQSSKLELFEGRGGNRVECDTVREKPVNETAPNLSSTSLSSRTARPLRPESASFFPAQTVSPPRSQPTPLVPPKSVPPKSVPPKSVPPKSVPPFQSQPTPLIPSQTAPLLRPQTANKGRTPVSTDCNCLGLSPLSNRGEDHNPSCFLHTQFPLQAKNLASVHRTSWESAVTHWIENSAGMSDSRDGIGNVRGDGKTSSTSTADRNNYGYPHGHHANQSGSSWTSPEEILGTDKSVQESLRSSVEVQADYRTGSSYSRQRGGATLDTLPEGYPAFVLPPAPQGIPEWEVKRCFNCFVTGHHEKNCRDLKKRDFFEREARRASMGVISRKWTETAILANRHRAQTHGILELHEGYCAMWKDDIAISKFDSEKYAQDFNTPVLSHPPSDKSISEPDTEKYTEDFNAPVRSNLQSNFTVSDFDSEKYTEDFNAPVRSNLQSNFTVSDFDSEKYTEDFNTPVNLDSILGKVISDFDLEKYTEDFNTPVGLNEPAGKAIPELEPEKHVDDFNTLVFQPQPNPNLLPEGESEDRNKYGCGSDIPSEPGGCYLGNTSVTGEVDEDLTKKSSNLDEIGTGGYITSSHEADSDSPRSMTYAPESDGLEQLNPMTQVITRSPGFSNTQRHKKAAAHRKKKKYRSSGEITGISQLSTEILDVIFTYVAYGSLPDEHTRIKDITLGESFQVDRMFNIHLNENLGGILRTCWRWNRVTQRIIYTSIHISDPMQLKQFVRTVSRHSDLADLVHILRVDLQPTENKDRRAIVRPGMYLQNSGLAPQEAANKMTALMKRCPNVQVMSFNISGGLLGFESLDGHFPNLRELQIKDNYSKEMVYKSMWANLRSCPALKTLKICHSMENDNVRVDFENLEIPVRIVRNSFNEGFPNLISLVLTRAPEISDKILLPLLQHLPNLLQLSIKDCKLVTSAGLSRALKAIPNKLTHLVFSVWINMYGQPTPREKLAQQDQSEHLCTTLRDSCQSLVNLQLRPYRICGDLWTDSDFKSLSGCIVEARSFHDCDLKMKTGDSTCFVHAFETAKNKLETLPCLKNRNIRFMLRDSKLSYH